MENKMLKMYQIVNVCTITSINVYLAVAYNFDV